MEMRKVQATGGSTLTVSLPKGWAHAAGLKRGAMVSWMPQADGALLLRAAGRSREPRQAVIAVGQESAGDLARRVIGAYLAGHDMIEVRADRIPAAERNAVRDITRRLMGAEIVEETADRILIQDLADAREFDMRRGVRRMGRMVKAMHEDAMRILATGDKELARDVAGRDDEVDRIYWLINKQYNLVLRDPHAAEGMGITPHGGLAYLLVGRILERIGDHAARIADVGPSIHGARVPAPILEDLGTASRIAVALVEDATEALFTSDVERANQTIRRAKELASVKKDLLARIAKLRPGTVLPVALVLESVERTGSYGTDIGEIAINHLYAG